MKIDVIKKLFIKPEDTLRNAIEVIDKNGKEIALVIDENERLKGIITDPDVRRAILRGVSLDCTAAAMMNQHFIFVTENYTKVLIQTLFEQKRIKQLPVLDEYMRVTDLILYHELNQEFPKENCAVIMAGGLGTRLSPLTNELPKPMLRVGNKPILETIIGQLKSYGFGNIVICLNYLGDIIENYFQNGSKFGVAIHYIREEKRLGTAGAIRLAKGYLDKPFFVVNGDILTKLNFDKILAYHQKHHHLITIGTRKHEFQIPYGIVDIKGELVTGLKEKPALDFFINAGIYCLAPQIIDFIPKDEYFDITQLIKCVLDNGGKVGSFPITEYWMDIGQIEDYYKAKCDYGSLFLEDAEVVNT